MTRGRRRGQRGQALVETAVVVGVILTLLMGVYSVSQYASDQNTAGTATRAGARLAAELGNGGYTPGNKTGCQATPQDPCALDRQIVQVVCQIAATMPFVTSITAVDVYRATGSGGSGDLTDSFTITPCAPNQAPAAAAYTLDNRVQTHPNEAYIGVSMTYKYKSPVPLLPLAATSTVYTVLQLSPHFA
ncbi:MAG: TadE family protein [Candidatus Dormibacteria bacterium]